MTVQVITPDNETQPPFKIFLAGSIDNGAAEDWQARISQLIIDHYDQSNRNIQIINPRKESWDPTIDPSSKDEGLITQINWELNQLQSADLIAMYFTPDSKAPISLLEFGMYCKDSKMIVYCPTDFYRSTNVHVTAEHNNCCITDDEDEWINILLTAIDVMI